MSVESGDVDVMPAEVSCANCIAACCRAGASLTMTHDEVYRHRRAMTLETILKPKPYPQITPSFRQEVIDENGKRAVSETHFPVKSRYGFYILLKDCGNITEDNQCGAYDERPAACQQYEVGSQECMDARAAYGLDGHEAQVSVGQEIPRQYRKVVIDRIQ